MGRIFEYIARLIATRKWLLAILAAGLTLFITAGLSKLQLSQSIYSIFPKNLSYSRYSDVLKDNSFNKKVIFSIANSGDNVDQLEQVAGDVKRMAGDLLTNYRITVESDEGKVLDFLLDNYPAYLTQDDYQRIQSKVSADSIDESLMRVRDKLSSSQGLFVQDYLAKDPLGFAGPFLQSLQPDTASGVQVLDGYFYTSDNSRILFFADLNYATSDGAKNALLNDKIQAVRTKLHSKFPQLKFEYFGTFRIATENAYQVRRDTMLTTSLSVSLILLLLIIFYRSVITPLLFVLPGIVGGLTGLAAAGWISDEISAISVGTSSVLLGIIINYSFHFFTHLKHSGDPFETVRSIAQPMLVGSFTTVAAFGALIFTDSVVLQNFGLTALFSLLGAALFTLLLLPGILSLIRFRMKRESSGERNGQRAGKTLARIGILTISGLTAFFVFQIDGFRFDSNLSNLGYHPEELVKLEQRYTGINPQHEKKLQIFVRSASRDSALLKARNLFETLQNLRSDYQLEQITSVYPFILAESDLKAGFSRWNKFWQSHTATKSVFTASTAKYDLNAAAFTPFYEQISGYAVPRLDGNIDDVTGLGDLISTSDGETVIATSVVVSKENLADFKSAIRNQSDAFVLDVADLAVQLLDSVQKDLNFLLLASSLIVFLSLLLVYGRIELALFAFFPMVFSWIWILGITSLFSVEFNFVNIIVATFIFGLGDDFSIFVTEDALDQLKFGRSASGSFRKAITLSGVTTIIGTGTLIFAKHPAINSIAALSVIGIACVLVTALIVQPAVFRFFVLNRVRKGLHPITLINFIRTLLLYLYFFIGCTHLNALLLLLLPLPISRQKKRKIINYCVSKLAWSTIYLGFHIRKKIIGRELLDFTKPKIFIANHGSFLDILLTLMLHPKLIIVVKEWVYRSPFFGLFIRFVGYLYVADGLENNVETVRKRMDEGYSVLIFPEGSRSPDGKIKRFHKGAFYLAEQLQVELQPILILGAFEVIPKNDFIIRDGNMIVKILPPIKPNDARFNKDYSKRGKEVLSYIRSEYLALTKEHAKSSFLQPQLLSNYLYKGPVLEWYFRIKWRLERANYELYDDLIGDRRIILDIGCGYGFLSYYLKMRQPDRDITGIDYDAEKISIAANGFLKESGLEFIDGDIRSIDLPQSDVVFLNDVLHYLEESEQKKLLAIIHERLNPGGIIFIRDGVTDFAAEFQSTRWTERLSTRWFRFNRTTNQLHFPSISDLKEFAEQHNYSFEMTRHSKTTSNTLFVLRK